MSSGTLEFIDRLEAVIADRSTADVADSYTARLLNEGPEKIAQKVGEEAVELAIAAVRNERQEIISEAADLLYHMLVLLQSRDLQLADVIRELEARHHGK